MRSSGVRGGLLGTLLVLSGCASPREHFYVLEPSAPESTTVLAKSATVLVGPVLIPLEIDRPQIVVRKGPYQIAFNEQVRWATPLKEALPRMVAFELSRNATTVARFVPVARSGSSTATARLAIDFTRFELSFETGATVALHWAYQSSATIRPPVEGVAVADSPIKNRGIEGLLDALRCAIAEAADTLAKQLPGES